ncbi:TolC family protein [Kaarinaea lacus]
MKFLPLAGLQLLNFSIANAVVIVSIAAAGYSYVCVAQSNFGVMTLEDAERLALHKDPLVEKAKAEQQSFQQRSVAAGTWPDPKLRMGISNISMDTFIFEDEPMTQAVVGLTQRLPPWGAVGAKSAQLEQLAEAQGHEVSHQELQTRLNVRQAWLEVYYQYQAEQLVEKSTSVFDQLKEVTRLQYRAGRGSQQAVVQAQLEKSLLQDRQTAIHTMWETAMARLKKWLGISELEDDLDMSFPQLKAVPEMQALKRSIEDHPWLSASKTRVKAAEKGVDYANAQSGLGWAIDLRYGYRGADRADLGSAMVVVDLPFFSGNRQDREIKASQSDVAASQNSLDERRRQLYQRLDAGMSLYSQADERLKLYTTQVLVESKQNTEASLSAYQSGVSDFSTLVRAQLTELNSQLQHLKLKVDKAKAQAELLYLAGN